MAYYLVFGSVKRPLSNGGSYLDWNQPPIGVYEGESADDACKVAASDHGAMGTYFAVSGFPWGLEMMTASASRFGSQGSPVERLERKLAEAEARGDRLRQLEEHTRQLERELLDVYDDELDRRIRDAQSEQRRRDLQQRMDEERNSAQNEPSKDAD